MSRAAINSLSISIHVPLITGLAASIGSEERGRPMTMNNGRERKKKVFKDTSQPWEYKSHERAPCIVTSAMMLPIVGGENQNTLPDLT